MRCRLWFNPGCSKCNDALDILERQGVDVDVVHYLEESPTRAEIEDVLALLGTDDPRMIIRVGEPEYAGLEKASRDELLEAMERHPILIQRPIAISEGRAVIGRPPERVLDLF